MSGENIVAGDAKEHLELSDEQFRRAIDGSPFPIMLHADDGEVIFINQAWIEISGYSHADIPTIGVWLKKAHGADAEMISAIIAPLYAMEHPGEVTEHPVRTTTGESRMWDFSTAPLGKTEDGRRFAITTARDVTTRRAAATAVQEQEQRLQAVIDNAPFGAHMYELTDDDRLVLIGYNRTAHEMLGVDHEALLGLTLEEAFPGNVGTETPERYREAAREGTTWETKQYAYDAGDISGVFQVIVFPYGQNRACVYFRDLTEKTRLEAALEDSEIRYKRLFETTREGFSYGKLIFDDEGRPVDWIFVDVNDAYERLSGFHDVIGKRVLEAIPNYREILPELFDACCRVGSTGEPEELDVERAVGTIHMSISCPEAGHFVALGWDISDRKRAEGALANSARALRALSGVNEVLVRAESEDELLGAVCDAIIQHAGYPLSWVGYAVHDEAKSIRPVGSAGFPPNALSSLNLSWDEGDYDAPGGRAIRTAKPVIVPDTWIGTDFGLWRDSAKIMGVRSSMSLPLVGAARRGVVYEAPCPTPEA